ncbi:XdhC family protein [Micromonospora sp. WMMD558]|uniref:XdhC family protein n=1 Tax=unclassified Micromonospora TaxID=2617518 RepID=UPI0012B479EA|nr:XdhC family protein [Micromonospora sp. WMMC415]QGN48597.1 YHS domain-containing protein [Micromonospora sp. WMMC415]
MTPVDLFARADGLRAQRTPFVLATVVRAERPTSAKPGYRAIVLPDGTIEGFVGGACAESTVRLQSLRLLRTGESTLLRVTPGAAAEQAPAEGMVVVDNPCLSGGTLDIFLEAVVPAPLVHVFGDTPIARAVAEVGAAAGYAVTRSTDPAAPIPPDTVGVVVAAHGHDEEAVLRAAVHADVPYVALVASRQRGPTVLAGADLPADLAARVRSPAGLDIGARTPGDVALSVLAELVQVRASTPGEATVPAQRHGDDHDDHEQAAGPGNRALLTVLDPATAVDPVCGMSVAVGPASLHLERAGRTWYFCAAGCRRAFAADPGRYDG